MQTIMQTTLAVAIATTISLAPAFAAGPKPSGGGYPTAAEEPAPAAPHYEWQYGYVGHHPRYEGHWVLVR
ncbi:MAG: hypothetical protein JO001_19545 [Alphaproteobacteria bacterium]|nr:hypothetical protein [Alphaproteobacteria bacterium]